MISPALKRPIPGAVYVLVSLHGLLTLVFPSEPISSVLGTWIVYFYGASFLFGGIVALIGLLRPNFKLESVALWPLFGAYALYDVALWTLVIDQLPHSDTLPAVYGPALVTAMVALTFLGKAITLGVQTRRLVRAVLESERG